MSKALYYIIVKNIIIHWLSGTQENIIFGTSVVGGLVPNFLHKF